MFDILLRKLIETLPRNVRRFASHIPILRLRRAGSGIWRLSDEHS